MELELGLKITHTRDDLTTTTTDLRIAKDPFGPLFWSKETNSMFILVIHLKGFRSERIEVEINKEGNQIVISGKKAVEEMVLIRWLMWRKEVELRAFRKVFQIPDVVDLDKIKARFNEEESTLKITMPKKVKGISGLRIEEYKEEEVEDVPDREHIEEAVEETNDKPPIIMKEAEVVETESPKELSKQEETSEQAEISSVEEQKEEPKDLPDGDGEEEIVAEESINLEDKKVAEQKIEQNVPEKVEEREAPVVENLLKETPDIPEPETPNEPVFDATQSAEEETLLPHESIEPQVAELLLPVEEPPDTKEPEVEEVPEIVQPATESPPPNKSPDTNITNENHEHPNEDEPSIDAEESIKPEPEVEESIKPDQTINNHEREQEQEQETPETEDETEEIKPPQYNPETNDHECKEEPNDIAAPKKKSKRSKLSAPLMVVGSTFLLSLIVIVIHLIRSKKK